MKSSIHEFAKLLLRQLLSLWENDASHPAARQKRPWGLSRWVLLIIYMVYATLTSSVYFGWRSMSALLLKSGQFEWVCDDQPDAQRPRGEGDGDSPAYLCELQDAKIQSLFTIAMASHFTCSALAGWMLDTVGPKTVALLGQLFNTLAWVLLAFSGPHFQAVIPAFVLMGAGADVSVYPTLLIVSLFPQNKATVMALMGACISASFFVPYVLKVLWQQVHVSFRMLCFIYVLVGPVFCVVLSLLFVPQKAFKGVDTFEVCVETEKLKKAAAGSASEPQECNKDTAATSGPQAGKPGEELGDLSLQLVEKTRAGTSTTEEANSTAAVTGTAGSSSSGFLRFKNEVALSKERQQEEHAAVNASEGGETTGRSTTDDSGEGVFSPKQSVVLEKGVSLVSVESFKEMKTTIYYAGEIEDYGGNPRFKKEHVSFLSQSLTFLYFGICIYVVVCGWAMSFFQEAAGRFLSAAVEHNLELLTPLSTLPCIVFGFLINRLGIMTVILALNTCGVVMYTCVVCAGSSMVAQHISVICFFLYISVFTTQMYVYIESTFDSSHFGKLIGVASMVGGLLSLLSNVLYGDVTVRLLSGDVRPVSGVLLALLALMYPVLLLMGIKRSRRRREQQLEAMVIRHAEQLKSEVTSTVRRLETIQMSCMYDRHCAHLIQTNRRASATRSSIRF